MLQDELEDGTNAKSGSESEEAGFMTRTLNAIVGSDPDLPSMEELKKNPFDDGHSDDYKNLDIYKSPFDDSPVKPSTTVTSTQASSTTTKPSNTHPQQSAPKLPVQAKPAEISPRLLAAMKSNREQVLTRFLSTFC